MRTFRSDLAALVSIALATLLTGCPGELQNPGRFRQGTGGPCDAPTQFLNEKCATGCHSAASRLGDLDLQSPGVASRLVRVKGTICTTSNLVEPDAPELSALYDKTAAQPSCGGDPMPLGGPTLSDAERACLLDWIASLPDPQPPP